MKRAATRLVLAAVIVSLSIIALPSPAATCSQSTDLDWWVVGEQIAGLDTASCTSGAITYHRVRVQEKVGFVWWTRAESAESINKTSDQELAVAGCVGHGQDLWRAEGYYEDSDGGSGTGYHPNTAGESYNCP